MNQSINQSVSICHTEVRDTFGLTDRHMQLRSGYRKRTRVSSKLCH